MDITAIQDALQRKNVDCWLVYDFQNSNPTLAQLVSMRPYLTRRLFLLIPAHGEPQVLGSRIDSGSIRKFPFRRGFYISWQEMQESLERLLSRYQTIAMDYFPEGMLPTASRVDAGTVEMIRQMDKNIVAIADVFQIAQWGPGVLEAHLEDCQQVGKIKDAAFELIGSQLQQGKPVTEYSVQSFIMEQFKAANLYTPYPPVVAVNAHSGNPLFSPTAKKHWPINPGDWVLIDLWAKRPGYKYVFSDMAWVAVVDTEPTPEQQAVFEVVVEARDAAMQFIQEQVAGSCPIEGWQVDDAARHHIEQAGYGDCFFHRTGHSLGPGNKVHGQGVNIDNLEAHDTRRLEPGVGFSIEPGVYLSDFGVRSEIDVFMDSDGPRVTTPIQKEIICLG